MKKLALHWQIIIGMALGILMGLLLSYLGFSHLAIDWIKPFGKIFINLLKLVAVPLVLVSLVKGITSLSDLSRLSAMGGKTVGLYLLTTVIAVTMGLVLVNMFEPGNGLPEEVQQVLADKYAEVAGSKVKVADNQQKQGPLIALEQMFSDNIFSSFTDNKNMLQVIVFALFFGVAIVMLPEEKTKSVRDLFEGLNEVIIQIVNIIMMGAPYGVFALLTALIAEFGGDDPSQALHLLSALAKYSGVVFIGLVLMAIVVYPLLIKSFTKQNLRLFFEAIAPAQLMAFSTSSSAATLPVTMKRVNENLGVSKETTSFVLPLGATVNMDGTSLYQAVAAVFIAQAYGIDLSIVQQLGIVLTATLASIGAAAVPGAGIVMLIIVLEQAGLPVSGIALILAPDRILDMCRTVVNVTGDASVSLIIDKTTNAKVSEKN